jgi:site-specific recombinase XerD
MDRNEFVDQFIEDQDWSKKHTSWSRRQLTIFCDYLDQNKIDFTQMTSGQFTRMLRHMREQGYSYSARNGLYTTAQAFYKWLKGQKAIENHPFSDPDMKPKRPKKERKVIKTVDPAYLEAILRTANAFDDLVSRRDRAMVHLMISTGMRRIEVAALKLTDRTRTRKKGHF